MQAVEYSAKNGQVNLKIDNTGFARPPKPQPDAGMQVVRNFPASRVDAAYRDIVDETLRPMKRKKRSSASHNHSGTREHGRMVSSNSTNLDEFMERQVRRSSVPAGYGAPR